LTVTGSGGAGDAIGGRAHIDHLRHAPRIALVFRITKA
jgi:hypothetical protein